MLPACTEVGPPSEGGSVEFYIAGFLKRTEMVLNGPSTLSGVMGTPNSLQAAKVKSNNALGNSDAPGTPNKRKLSSRDTCNSYG